MAVTRHSDAVAPVRTAGPVSVWATRHVSTAIGALGRLARQPFASLMIVLVIAVTLALPAAINLVVKNAHSISGSWDNALDFSVFLKPDMALGDAEALAQLIGQRADVEVGRTGIGRGRARRVQATIRLRRSARPAARQSAAAYARRSSRSLRTPALRWSCCRRKLATFRKPITCRWTQNGCSVSTRSWT